MKECSECHNKFDGKMPGWKYGSNWEWVPCYTCNGKGVISDESEESDITD